MDTKNWSMEIINFKNGLRLFSDYRDKAILSWVEKQYTEHCKNVCNLDEFKEERELIMFDELLYKLLDIVFRSDMYFNYCNKQFEIHKTKYNVYICDSRIYYKYLNVNMQVNYDEVMVINKSEYKELDGKLKEDSYLSLFKSILDRAEDNFVKIIDITETVINDIYMPNLNKKEIQLVEANKLNVIQTRMKYDILEE